MRRILAILAVGAIAAGGGCSDDDGDADPRSDFVKTADRICLRSGLRPQGLPGDLPHAAEQLAEEARLRAEVHAKLAELHPPAHLRADYERFVDQTGRVARDLGRMAKLARGGHEADLGELGRRAGELESGRLRLAKRMGFRRCGRPITEPVRTP
ncbi:MAG TPA: hypothetical protein VF712_15415 [Thermoleophilaceae bacterium]|jgi:hypothetical protein